MSTGVISTAIEGLNKIFEESPALLPLQEFLARPWDEKTVQKTLPVLEQNKYEVVDMIRWIFLENLWEEPVYPLRIEDLVGQTRSEGKWDSVSIAAALLLLGTWIPDQEGIPYNLIRVMFDGLEHYGTRTKNSIRSDLMDFLLPWIMIQADDFPSYSVMEIGLSAEEDRHTADLALKLIGHQAKKGSIAPSGLQFMLEEILKYRLANLEDPALDLGLASLEDAAAAYGVEALIDTFHEVREKYPAHFKQQLSLEEKFEFYQKGKRILINPIRQDIRYETFMPWLRQCEAAFFPRGFSLEKLDQEIHRVYDNLPESAKKADLGKDIARRLIIRFFEDPANEQAVREWFEVDPQRRVPAFLKKPLSKILPKTQINTGLDRCFEKCTEKVGELTGQRFVFASDYAEERKNSRPEENSLLESSRHQNALRDKKKSNTKKKAQKAAKAARKKARKK